MQTHLLPLAADHLPQQLLTPREQQVLRLLATGHTSVQLAAHLHISVETVKSHRRSLFRKLGASTSAALIYRAFQVGLLSH